MVSEKEKSTKEIIAYLDRIEIAEDGASTAIFYVEADEDEYQKFNLPTDLLPDDATEGDYLTITIARIKEE